MKHTHDPEEPHHHATAEEREHIDELRADLARAKAAHAKAVRRALRLYLSPPVREYAEHLKAYRALNTAIEATHTRARLAEEAQP